MNSDNLGSVRTIPAGARKLQGAEPSAETGRAAATIQILLETAERLFAEKGVDHVSLRQIVLASGHKNLAALHYHFGSRAALVTEVLRNRREKVDARRNRYLDELLKSDDIDLRSVVSATIKALAHSIRDTDWGRRYISVLAQTTLSPQLRADAVTRSNMSGLMRTHALLSELLTDLPEPILKQRVEWFTQTIIYSLVHWCQDHPEIDAQALDTYTEWLIDFCMGGLLGGRPSANPC